MSDEQIIRNCISEIEQKYSWGSCSGWTNYHFTQLSSDIEKVTGKRISDSTLKRILGKKKTDKDIYTPQVYTKNTLAEFLGYGNWEEFRRSGDTEVGGVTEVTGVQNTDAETKIKTKYKFLEIIRSLIRRKKKASFYCANPKSRVPFTAIFHYDISGVKDYVMMDTGNGYSLPLPRDRNMITEFYSKAGYFDVKLYTKKNPELASVRLHNLSKGWQGGTSSNDDSMFFKPVSDQSICREKGYLHIAPQHIQSNGIDLNSLFWTDFRCFDEFNADVDNITASLIAKNDPKEGGKNYNDIQLILIGENGRINFRFIGPDAHCFVDLEFGEKHISGRYNELSVFSRDTSDWRNIGIKNTSRSVAIFFEKQPVYSIQYGRSIGRLKGMIVRFFGCGALREIKIANQQGVVIYGEEFKQ